LLSPKAKPLPQDKSQAGKSFLTLHTGTSKGKVVPVEDEDDYTMTHHHTVSVHAPGDDRSRLVDMGGGAGDSGAFGQPPPARRPLPRLSVAGQPHNRLASHVSEGSEGGSDEDSEYLETAGPHSMISAGPSASSEREMALHVVATVQRQVEQLTASAREQMDHYNEHQQAALEMEVQRIQGSSAPGSPSKYVVSRQDAKRVAVKAQEVAETAAALARKAAAILEQANAYNAVSHDGQSLKSGSISALSPATKSDIQQRYATLQSTVNESLRSTRNAGIMPDGVAPSADHWGDYARSTGRGAPGSPGVGSTPGSVGTANQDGSPSGDGDGDATHRGYSPQRAAGVATMAASRSESALRPDESGFLVPSSPTSGGGGGGRGDVLGDVEMQQGRNAARERAGTPVLATPTKPTRPAEEEQE